MSDYDESDAPRKPKRQTKRSTGTSASADQPTDQDNKIDTGSSQDPARRPRSEGRPRADSGSRPRTNSRSDPKSGHKSGTTQERDGGRDNDAKRSNTSRSSAPRSEGDRRPYQKRSSGGDRPEGDRPPRGDTRRGDNNRDSSRSEGYRPVNSGARRNTDSREGDRTGDRTEGNRRPYQRRSDSSSGDRPPRRDSSRSEGYRPVNSGARRNTDSREGDRTEGNRRPYQNRSESSGDRPPRRDSSRSEGYRPVNSGARRNTDTREGDRSEATRRPYQRRDAERSGDRPSSNTESRPPRRDTRSDDRPPRSREGEHRGSRRSGYREYDPTTAPSKRGARTGWDAVASWYDGWVGKDGSQHHQQLAIPATMELLALKQDEKILDIGAGQGVLATYVTQVGAEYTGVDVSPRLLDLAKKHHGMYGRFVQADACKLSLSNEIQAAGYDAAAFLLSLQDINPLADALQSVAWALKPGGRVVLLMTHPCFRIPRQSGWGYDENRKLTYRRIDHYMTPLNVPMKSYLGGSGVTISFHRPLHEYINGLAAAGLVIDQMREITSYKAEENAEESEIPVFMAIRARKLDL